jgi:hypothetical protein
MRKREMRQREMKKLPNFRKVTMQTLTRLELVNFSFLRFSLLLQTFYTTLSFSDFIFACYCISFFIQGQQDFIYSVRVYGHIPKEAWTKVFPVQLYCSNKMQGKRVLNKQARLV